MPSPTDSLPLVDTDLASEFFIPQGEEGSDAMQREIWSDLSAALIPDLQAVTVHSHEADSLRTELHRIRGYCLTCALVRLAAFLQEWEHLPAPLEATVTYAPRAIALARRSMLEIELAYPHLKPQAVRY